MKFPKLVKAAIFAIKCPCFNLKVNRYVRLKIIHFFREQSDLKADAVAINNHSILNEELNLQYKNIDKI